MQNRNIVEYENFIISPVTDFSIFTGFSCLNIHDTDRDLDDFIHNDAKKHEIDKVAITYSLMDKSLLFPLGFATLQNDAINIEKSSAEEFSTLSEYKYKWFPAVKIGRLGIKIEYQKQQLGSLFLQMLITLMQKDNRTGCRFITVDARRDKKNKVDVQKFYEKNGFEVLTAREKTSTYIPMYYDLVHETT